MELLTDDIINVECQTETTDQLLEQMIQIQYHLTEVNTAPMH